MLRRIGIASAIAWSAPVVTSLRTPAFGQAISGAGCACGASCGETAGCSPSDCFCLTSVEGREFCSQNFTCDPEAPTCSSSADCPAGWVCQPAIDEGPCTGSCGRVCVPPCGTCGPGGLASRTGARTNRRTNAA
jgi:hypothetical protein